MKGEHLYFRLLSTYVLDHFLRTWLEMSTLAFIENTFRYALVMLISEEFFIVSFLGIVFFRIVLTYVLLHNNGTTEEIYTGYHSLVGT